MDYLRVYGNDGDLPDRHRDTLVVRYSIGSVSGVGGAECLRRGKEAALS